MLLINTVKLALHTCPLLLQKPPHHGRCPRVLSIRRVICHLPEGLDCIPGWQRLHAIRACLPVQPKQG